MYLKIFKIAVDMRMKINTIFSREFCDSYQYDVIRKIEVIG